MGDAGPKWQTPARKPDFLFPVRALSKVFRGKFMAALAQARKDGQIGRNPQSETPAWGKRQRQLYRHDWVVYARAPLAGPAQVLEYLSRYTHRTTIGNQRIHPSRAAKAWRSLSTASQALQSNEVYLPQEVIDDLRRLGAAADNADR